ncbi:MAG: amidohydrolase family protein [Candidatus Rokubacteria bacterium]|nr:amidohydrolase family protein [Candidatus Rokubacteria bacterium]
MTARRVLTRLAPAVVLAAALCAATPGRARAAEYTGPLIDAHSHLPSAGAITAYVEAMKRHGVTRVVLLGVGGVQKDDPAWIAAAARRYPDRVVAGLPLSDPTGAEAAARLDAALTRGRAPVVGEVHLRQMGRRAIERDPGDPAFGRILDVLAKHAVPVVVHYELTDRAAAALERALAAHRAATVVLAHAGAGPPARVEGLLARNPNLRVDLSGMHFQRTPALATETGPLDPAWKALIERFPDRFLVGVDVWAPRLFEPAMLDRLLAWTRRVLGELRADVAERVAWRNATTLFRLE